MTRGKAYAWDGPSPQALSNAALCWRADTGAAKHVQRCALLCALSLGPHSISTFKHQQSNGTSQIWHGYRASRAQQEHVTMRPPPLSTTRHMGSCQEGPAVVSFQNTCPPAASGRKWPTLAKIAASDATPGACELAVCKASATFSSPSAAQKHPSWMGAFVHKAPAHCAEKQRPPGAGASPRQLQPRMHAGQWPHCVTPVQGNSTTAGSCPAWH